MTTPTMPKLIEFRAKAATGAEPGTITGPAVPIGKEIDQGSFRHIIEPGCFAAQIKDPARVKILWQHRDPIGHLSDLIEEDGAYRYAGRVIDHPTVPNGQLAMTLVREGVVDEVSVGFEWQKYTEEHIVNATDDYWLIRHHKARLMEVSIVPWGAAGRDATIQTAAAKTGPTVAEWRHMLGL